MLILDKSSFTYTSLFCEENIWKLIASLMPDKEIETLDVLFISNKSRSVALFGQTSAIDNQPVIWDYHVIATARINNDIYVLDFDSHCEFPILINEYFKRTFSPTQNAAEQYLSLIKPIKSDYFHNHFYSDRSHMKGIIPESEFPQYSIIQPEQGLEKLTLQECIDMTITTEYNKTYTPEEYLTCLSGSECSNKK